MEFLRNVIKIIPHVISPTPEELSIQLLGRRSGSRFRWMDKSGLQLFIEKTRDKTFAAERPEARNLLHSGNKWYRRKRKAESDCKLLIETVQVLT